MTAHTPSFRFLAAQPDHHPTEEFIAAYAAGVLDEASSLAIAGHLTLCPACRAVAGLYDVVGGALIDALPASPLSEDALSATLTRARTAAPARQPQTQMVSSAERQILPAPLRHYVGGDLDKIKWRTLGPGISHVPLVRSGDVIARLLRINPGKAIFNHTHRGTELTLVLNGSYNSQGQCYRRGDIEMADDSVDHGPVAGPEDVCICLIVTDAPLRFHHWLGRLMQPLTGI
jgi:putative transcriptional regulator